MKRALLLLFALMCFTAPALATTVLPMDLDDLTRASDAIVVATVASTEAFIEEGRVYTRIALDVEETWKGAPLEKVEIVHIGGRTKTLATMAHGMPGFVAGERALVFLEKPKSVQHFVVTGLTQGKFALRRNDAGETLVIPQLDPASIAKPSPLKKPRATVKLEGDDKIVTPLQLHQTLPAFRARVDKILALPATTTETE